MTQEMLESDVQLVVAHNVPTTEAAGLESKTPNDVPSI
jgi:hypothetical protein